MVKIFICLVFLLSVCELAVSQGFLRGKVFDRSNDKVVEAASINNITRNRMAQSDGGGNYRVYADIRDLLVFSSVGYKRDTVSVTDAMLFSSLDIYLVRDTITLRAIKVGDWNSYQLDSISRREEFGDKLGEKDIKLVGGRGNRPTDGVGIAFSPINFFSRREREKRQFKKDFEEREEQAYVDHRFSAAYVSGLTPLRGDSLQQFMVVYRPSYSFCRLASKEEMLLYVNEKYKIYMKREKK